MTPRGAFSLPLLVICGCSLGGFDYLSASYGESNSAGAAGNGDAAGSAGAQSGAGTAHEAGALGNPVQEGGATGAAGSPAAAPGELDGEYQLVVAHSSKCLDAGGALTPAGNVAMQQLGCVESPTQSFTLREADDAYGISITGSDDCLEVEDASRQTGARIVRSPCSSEPSQRWLPSERALGLYAFENALSGKCLDVMGSSPEDHIGIDQWTCQNAPNQNWVLASLTPLALPLTVDDAFWSMAWTGLEYPPTVIAPNELGGSRDCEGRRAPAARGFCHSAYVGAFPEGTLTAGARWLHPAQNQGTFPGRRIATGALRVRFQARGEQGGEIVTFGAGGNMAGTFQDSFAVSTPPITLSTEWQSFSVDLTSIAYSSAIVAFYWRMEITANVAPFQIYIDDVTWE